MKTWPTEAAFSPRNPIVCPASCATWVSGENELGQFALAIVRPGEDIFVSGPEAQLAARPYLNLRQDNDPAVRPLAHRALMPTGDNLF